MCLGKVGMRDVVMKDRRTVMAASDDVVSIVAVVVMPLRLCISICTFIFSYGRLVAHQSNVK
jgi:hypothetical protein